MRSFAGSTARCSSRASDGSAKVMVVGQEGAQDESLSHRSFTGGTGARMQYLLRFLGFDRSYLFLNSFVYPIFGQYTPDLRPLAQDRRSPIAAHRNRIFDKAAIDGDVRLVIAVGRAAKESVARLDRGARRFGGPGEPAYGVARLPAGPAPGGRGAAPRQRGIGIDGRDQGRLHPGDRARQGLSSRPTPAGFRPTPASRAIWRRRSRTPRWQARSVTFRSAPARALAPAERRATGPITSGRSACSRRRGSTTPAART